MSLVKQCDRCKKILQNETVAELKVNVWGRGGTYISQRTYHLCMNCTKEFDKFMGNDKPNDAE